MKVFKLKGEAYEITEFPEVYASKEKAVEAVGAWSDFLGMGVAEALETEEVIIEEWTLV